MVELVVNLSFHAKGLLKENFPADLQYLKIYFLR